MNAGLVGGIAGGVIGILGGLIGTYCSIKNTGGPREKAFMIQCALVGWIAITAFLLLLLFLPRPYNFLMWIPYGVLLPVAIIYGNKKQQAIRAGEQKDK